MLTKEEQRQLLTNFFDQVRDALLSRSDDWPEEWDGYELRELAYLAMEYERTDALKDGRSRRSREFWNHLITHNLY